MTSGPHPPAPRERDECLIARICLGCSISASHHITVWVTVVITCHVARAKGLVGERPLLSWTVAARACDQREGALATVMV